MHTQPAILSGSLVGIYSCSGREEGPFFRFEDNHLLTKDHYVQKVREALTHAEVNVVQYSGHSFQIGATTTVNKKGLFSEKIQTLDIWESSAYLLYIRLSREELAAISETINTRCGDIVPLREFGQHYMRNLSVWR